jgi:hypothetical protein
VVRRTTGPTSGTLAGAGGAKVLNAFTYPQQAIKGTPSSATSDQAAHAAVNALGGEVPGSRTSDRTGWTA